MYTEGCLSRGFLQNTEEVEIGQKRTQIFTEPTKEKFLSCDTVSCLGDQSKNGYL